jgi:hypothetical protein
LDGYLIRRAVECDGRPLQVTTGADGGVLW